MDEQIKKEYEIGFLLNEESDLAGLMDALKSMGAEIRQEGPVRKIALAYEIKKHSSAWFGSIQFAMEPAAAKSLEAALNMRPEVLRFLLITPPTIKEKPYQQMAPGGTAGPSRPSAKPFEGKAAPASLSNEALEKKIEEILQ